MPLPWLEAWGSLTGRGEGGQREPCCGLLLISVGGVEGSCQNQATPDSTFPMGCPLTMKSNHRPNLVIPAYAGIEGGTGMAKKAGE